MADTAVAITAGSGTNIDTRTEATNGNHRQVVVVGDPATNAGVAPVDATAGLKVDLGADNDVTATLSATDNAVLDQLEVNTSYGDNTGGGVEAGALRVTLANDSTGVLSVDDNGGSLTVDGTVTANLSATDNAVLDAIEADTTTLAGAVTGTEVQVDVVAALPAGTNAIGKLAANDGVDIGNVDVATIAAGSNLIGDVGLGVRTSGGTTIFRSLDLDETEEEIKATAGQVYWIHAMNLTAATLYLKIYNATAANVIVGTTTPVLTFPIATQGDTNGAGFTFSVPNGIAFSTAITAAVTTGIADNDTTGPAANGCVLNLGYN